MKLYAFVTCANDIGYAPRKTHIINEDGNILCGRVLMGMPTVDADKKWINQPDYYRDLCQTCKKIANKKILEVGINDDLQ